MSVETKIRNLLEATQHKDITKKASTPDVSGDVSMPKQGSSKEAKPEVYDEYSSGNKISVAASKDGTLKPSEVGDTKQPRQGDSQDPSYQDLDGEKNGVLAGEKANQDSTIKPSVGREQKSMKQGDSKDATFEVKKFTKEDLDTQIQAVFGEDVSDEFKQKAGEIFEAAVIARVNAELERLQEVMESKFNIELDEAKESLAEDVDKYLNYVTEQWMTKNELAIETGIKSELTESFIKGLKALFEEHYIDVPEEKVDVMESLSKEVSDVKSKLDEAVEKNLELTNVIQEFKKENIVKNICEGLAKTEVEKFKTLIEGIEFGNESSYKAKLEVVKNANFSKTKPLNENNEVQSLNESSTFMNDNSRISSYAKVLSKTKF